MEVLHKVHHHKVDFRIHPLWILAVCDRQVCAQQCAELSVLGTLQPFQHNCLLMHIMVWGCVWCDQRDSQNAMRHPVLALSFRSFRRPAGRSDGDEVHAET